MNINTFKIVVNIRGMLNFVTIIEEKNMVAQTGESDYSKWAIFHGLGICVIKLFMANARFPFCQPLNANSQSVTVRQEKRFDQDIA